jgi:outer membrane protein assembly factor BamB
MWDEGSGLHPDDARALCTDDVAAAGNEAVHFVLLSAYQSQTGCRGLPGELKDDIIPVCSYGEEELKPVIIRVFLCLVFVTLSGAMSCSGERDTALSELRAADAPLGLPALPALPPNRSAKVLVESLIPGYATLSRSAGASDDGVVLQLNAGTETLEWGMYAFDPQGKSLDSLAAVLDVPAGGSAWLALADYESQRWEWQGPFDAGKTLAVDEPRYLSPDGLLYCLVAKTGTEGITVNALSVRTNKLENLAPVVELTADLSSGIAPLAIQFDASLSVDPDGSIAYYLWDFDGDGGFESTSFTPIAIHTYSTVGTFMAGLAVVDDEGAHASAMLEITISPPAPDPVNLAPLAMFSTDKTTSLAPFIISFDASASSDADGTIALYEWDFDNDGAFDAYGPSPLASHTYAHRGEYRPSLRITDDKGAQATLQQTLTLPTEWSMFGSNIRRTSQSPYIGSATKNVKWTYLTGDDVFSSPAIGVDGTIYIGGTDMQLHAINPDGTMKWTFPTGGKVYSSPAIGADGTIYVGSDDFNMYAINQDGSLKWTFPTGNWVFSSPAIDADGTLYFGSLDNHLYAVNPDGSLQWSFLAGDWVRSSPVIGDDGSIYFGCYDFHIYALKPDGSLKWKYLTGKGIYASPAIGANGTIYIGSFDDNLYAMNPDGTVKWSFLMGDNISSSPAIANDGTIYVGSWDMNMYAINPDGSLKWAFPTGNWVNSCPTIGADGIIYFGSADHRFYAVKPNGFLKWKLITDNWVRSSPAIARDGTIYFGSEDSMVYAIGE